MKSTITITSKGQTTLPAPIRRKLGLGSGSGILAIDFDEEKNAALITKPMTIEELSVRASAYIRRGAKPVMDVDAYYQKHRKPRL